jgi:hypothetical protein
MITTQELLGIDEQLRLILFGLECTLDVEFNSAETERVFADEREGGSSPKNYVFYERPGLRVIGQVDDYEPGDLWLVVESRRHFQPSLTVITERAKFQVYRLHRSHDQHQTSDL